MDLILILMYVVVNLTLVVVYYRREMGVFQAPFLLACISLSVLLPQLTTIYFSPKYDNNLLYKLCYVAISCNIAFAAGFDKAIKSSLPKTLRIIQLGKMKYLTLLFSLLSLTTIFLYRGGLGDTDVVLASNLRIFSNIGLSLSLISILQGERSRVIYISLIFSLIPLLNYALFVKGSRIDSLVIVLYSCLFLIMYFPRRSNLIKMVVLSFLLFGSILSASISGIRKNVRGLGDAEMSISQISYWDVFVNSFSNSGSDVGMDLGNAAIGIEFCYQNNSYDYGLQIWNGFVYNYVPKRIFGEEFKQSLFYNPEYRYIVPKLTNSITTMTGYFSAFSAFSFFGFLFFGIVGYGYGLIWRYGAYSTLYKFIYFLIYAMVPIMLTHGFQAIFGNIEFILMVIYPMLSFFIMKVKLIKMNNLVKSRSIITNRKIQV